MNMSHEQQKHALLGWQAQGGPPRQSGDLYQFGRRVEVDGSWTIYHVFTGTPAHIGSWTMTGLNRRDADKALTILNTH